MREGLDTSPRPVRQSSFAFRAAVYHNSSTNQADSDRPVLINFALVALALSVIDGDTVRRGGETYRIANIDAPEIKSAKCDAEARLALVAKRRLEQILASGKVKIISGDPATGRMRDRHNRILARIFVNGRDVGDTLVMEGLARPWEGRRRSWCAPN